VARNTFPRRRGPELTHATHWLGALASVEKVIGRSKLHASSIRSSGRLCARTRHLAQFSGNARQWPLRTHALFCGDFRQAVRQAAEVSRHVHIKYTGRKYRRVIALLDEHLNDLWVGGKASYRLGPVIEENGELIIYAPHLTCLSDVHGELIKRYGYAPLERIRELVAKSGRTAAEPLCSCSSGPLLSFAGRRLADGTIVPRYSITLASRWTRRLAAVSIFVTWTRRAFAAKTTRRC